MILGSHIELVSILEHYRQADISVLALRVVTFVVVSGSLTSQSH